MPFDAQQLAEIAGKTMYERDPASQKLGMTLDEIRPGYARMSMRVREDMLNGHATCRQRLRLRLQLAQFQYRRRRLQHRLPGP
jgi:hypothetical protein